MTLINAGLIALVSDILMPITLVTIWLVVARDQPKQTTKLWAGLVLIGAATLAAATAWYPPLAAIRLEPAPGAQVAVVPFLAFGLPSILLSLPATRPFLARIDPLSAARIGIWRAVYGSVLLAMGLAGGLPEGFYRSVATGDIAVGLWALWIVTRSNRVSDHHLLAWNVAGLIDLLHVIPLAITILRPFIIANPDVPTLNLLPLAGVPLFIALHIVTIRNLAISERVVPA
ncbi:MAG: hypothetical protein B7Y43_15165 [Sphingomonas sp. 28-62-20]|uniref:hypothetical protein n=1 Tax=Sphingomonas sp. 28-62-20 TaxID=1970433 RepID=UPI000BCD1E79|nr:MAG: hypothetical protein B7Y43_15165 [Sphingomonas sp. 28-62-20]